MQCCPHNVKCVGATWGISGDVCYMYIVFFCRYAKHDLRKVVSLELTMGISPICHRLHRLIYLASFSFGEERIGPAFVMILYMHVHE
jgi:hypothetical protein